MRAPVVPACFALLLCVPLLCPATLVLKQDSQSRDTGYHPEDDELDPLDMIEESPDSNPCPTARLLRSRSTCDSDGVQVPCMQLRCCDTHVYIAGRCVPKTVDPCSQQVCEQACEVQGERVWCSCYTGFAFHHGNYRKRTLPYCVDVDECADQNGGCEQRCINEPGGFHCECDLPMRLGTDGRRCEPTMPMPEPLPLTRSPRCYAPCDTVSWLTKKVRQLSEQLRTTHTALNKLMKSPLLKKDGGDRFVEGTSVYRVLDATAPLEGGHCRCERGPRGPAGPPGMEGPKGDTGSRGPRGAEGPKGSLDLMLLLLADIRHDIRNLEARVFKEGENPDRFNLQKAWRHNREEDNLEAERATEPELEAYTSPSLTTASHLTTDDEVEISSNGLDDEIVHSTPSTEYQAITEDQELHESTLSLTDVLQQLRLLANATAGADDDEDEDDDEGDDNFY